MNKCEILILDLNNKLEHYCETSRIKDDSCFCFRVTNKSEFHKYFDKIDFDLILFSIDKLSSEFLNEFMELITKYQEKKFIFRVEAQGDYLLSEEQKNTFCFSSDDFMEKMTYLVCQKCHWNFGQDSFLKDLGKFLIENEMDHKLFSLLIGDLTRKKRQSLSFNQEEFSHKVGLSLRQLQRIESGKSNPTLENLIYLLKGLSI